MESQSIHSYPFVPIPVQPTRTQQRKHRGGDMDMAPAARHVGILCIAVAAGCASVGDAPPIVPIVPIAPFILAQAGPLQVDPLLVAPSPHRIVAAEPPEVAAKEKSKLKAVRTDINQGADNVARPSAKPLAKLPVPVATVAQMPRNVAPAPVAGTQEPPLDVAALKLRLRDTNAIGVFTKLTLKNQVDDLLKQFRSHYLSGQKTGVANLRQPYDLLVLKVLALIQDGDPLLARTISGSREAIWVILADPEQFKLVS